MILGGGGVDANLPTDFSVGNTFNTFKIAGRGGGEGERNV